MSQLPVPIHREWASTLGLLLYLRNYDQRNSDINDCICNLIANEIECGNLVCRPAV